MRTHAFLAAVRIPIRNSPMHIEVIYDEMGASLSARRKMPSHSPAAAPLRKGILLEFRLLGFGAGWRARNRP
jgi:hypothetical protein